MPEMINYKTLSLNEKQLEVVTTINGPLLVLAGAGTGKTKALTSRIIHILDQGLSPNEIMAVTFTNKAAKEIEERVAMASEMPIKSIFMGTFHSVCTRILRIHANTLGISNSFSIADKDEQNRIIKRILKENDIDEKTISTKNLINVISHWKNRGLVPDKVKISDLPFYFSPEIGGKVINLYEEYQNTLIALNALDFGDLLLYTLNLFLENEDILQLYQNRIKYIMVDEYQDTNISQYLLIRILAQSHQNICCVGDDDQSIYSWRGAEISNILKFEKDFPNAKIIRMEQNYRSTSHILSTASYLISNNKNRLGKNLWTKDIEGEKVNIVSAWDDTKEANYISSTIQELNKESGDVDFKKIAVLVRASFQTRAIEESFINHGISYKIIAGARFYERLEIKDAIAYLRLVINESDGLAFERVINTPKRGIGASTLFNIRQKSRDWNLPLIETAQKMLEENLFKESVSLSLGKFFENIEHWKNGSKEYPPSELMNIIINQSGYLQMWQDDHTMEGQGRVENLKELIKVLEQYENAEEFLEHISLVMDKEYTESNNMVSVMTLHSAKGLEFDIVFLPGWEEELFPNQRAIEEKSNNGLEEERRLAYVGITRGKRQVFISYTTNRRMYGRYKNSIPSRFISELPSDHVHKIYLSSDTYQPYTKKKNYLNDSNDLYKSRTKKSNSNYEIAEKVFHTKFGHGRILNINDNKLEIYFEKHGKKTVIETFIEKVPK